MRWAPEQGHVPRGFCGATGSPEDVRLVLVCAEPGDPHESESHSRAAPLDSVCEYAHRCFRDGKDLFHRNVRMILDMCYPGRPFAAQMRATWITDSVLCSARLECGGVPASASHECRGRFLEPQLALFPNALVAATRRQGARPSHGSARSHPRSRSRSPRLQSRGREGFMAGDCRPSARSRHLARGRSPRQAAAWRTVWIRVTTLMYKYGNFYPHEAV